MQEQHIRDVAKQYFEAEEDSSGAGQSAEAEEAEGLPLETASNFMAKDVRMLLRESASIKARGPQHFLGLGGPKTFHLFARIVAADISHMTLCVVYPIFPAYVKCHVFLVSIMCLTSESHAV